VPFDLYYFGKRDQAKMAGRLNHLTHQVKAMEEQMGENTAPTEDIPRLEDFAKAMHSGNDAVFDRHGAIMAPQWVMEHEDETEIQQGNANAVFDVSEADLEILRSKKFLEEAEKKEAER
jgi:hypothetical protein